MTDNTLTATAPNGEEITGTLENVMGRSGVTFHKGDDGRIRYEYDGETEMFWDSSETQTRGGRVVFLCEGGQEWTADEITFRDATGRNKIKARTGWNENQPTRADKLEQAARAMLAALKAYQAFEERDDGTDAARFEAMNAAMDAAIAAAEAAGITTTEG